MVATGFRLLLAAWPRLLALYLLGAIGRQSVLWLATVASGYNGTIGVLLIPLAPLCVLVSMVMMLRVCGEYLPALPQPEASGWRERLVEDLTLASRVLIPFLAVYAAQGLLHEDAITFVRNATLDEYLGHFFRARYDRVLLADGWALAGIVLVGLGARKLIARYELAERSLAWGAVGGYVEALWLVTLARTLVGQLADVRTWLESRRFAAPFLPAWEAVQGWVAQASAWVRWPLEFLESLVGNAGALIVVPIAWLALGAMVFGAQLRADELPLTHEAVTRRIAAMPERTKRLLAQAVEAAVTPFQDTWLTIRRVTSVGVLVMVAFCLMFAAVGEVPVLVALIARRIMGPGDWLWQNALYPYVTLAERGAYALVTIAMLAAAVNVLVVGRGAQSQPADEPAPVAAG